MRFLYSMAMLCAMGSFAAAVKTSAEILQEQMLEMLEIQAGVFCSRCDDVIKSPDVPQPGESSLHAAIRSQLVGRRLLKLRALYS